MGRTLSVLSLTVCLFILAACVDTFTFVKNTTDQNALTAIALNDPDPYVRQQAAKKIADQKTLMQIAQTDSDTTVRQQAVAGIVDQEILKQIAETNDSPYIQREATKKITDETALIGIVQNFPFTLAGHEAVNKITDQAVLSRIVLSSSSNPSRESVYFRSKALKRLTDPMVLKQIEQTDVDTGVRLLAETTLADLHVLNRAAERLIRDKTTRHEALAQIARTDPDEKVRYLAVDKMTDQKNLPGISRYDQNRENATEPYPVSPDQAILTRIALTDPDEKVRLLAADRVTDPGALKQIAENEPNQKIRYAVVSRLTDQNPLTRIAQYDPDDDIRYLAARTLLELDGAVATSETTPVKQILLEPEIIAYWGSLNLYCREFWTVQEYSNGATFNRRHLEIKIVGKNNKIIFHKFYSTRSGNIVESFVRVGPGHPAPAGGGLVDVDYSEICAALLKPFDSPGLEKISRSKNKLLRETALSSEAANHP